MNNECDIKSGPQLLAAALAWRYASKISGEFTKYIAIWKDKTKQNEIVLCITIDKFDTLMYAHGHKIILCLLDYFISIEDYLKCAIIVKQIKEHNTTHGEHLATVNILSI